MLQHSGYELRELRQERNACRIFRARRRRDDRAVLLMFGKNSTTERAGREPLLREYEMLAGLHSPRIMTVLDLEQDGDEWFLVWDDFSGLSLGSWLEENSATIEDALRIGVALADGLTDLHQQRIVHGALQPEHILYDAHSGAVKIWGIRAECANESCRQDPAYLAPEQTGRMRRGADWRADLYALGMVLYRLFAGKLPFEAQSGQEWIHCHMAVAPLPLSLTCPVVPTVIGELVMRLLLKEPDLRYQTAAGVAYDLQHCLEAWREKNGVPPFMLGTHDTLDVLTLPNRLYGRDTERKALLTSLEKACRREGQTLILFGPAGVGKSTLARELQWPVRQAGGLFGEGKFQQLHRGLPYFGWREACAEIIAQLMARPAEERAALREKLTVAVGEGLAALVNFLPDGEALLGTVHSDEVLSGAEEEKRLFVAVKRFWETVADEKQPIVLFLDDLQWADPASLKLFRELACCQAALVLVAAYRDGDLEAGNPLTDWLQGLDQSAPSVIRLAVAAHPYPVARQIVEDVLGARGEEVNELTELIYRRTQGNILFLFRFLENLHDQGILSFSTETGRWQWSIQEIRETPIAENVIGLMMDKVRNLPEATLELLVLAACVGSRVSRESLAAISGQSTWQVAANLRLAVAEGLLATAEYGYKFAHDRIQEVAYRMMERGRARLYHLQIARRLYETLQPNERGKRIFELADQWNLAAGLLDDPHEQRRVMILNLEAGRRAKASAAYRSAHGYFAAGILLQQEAYWQSDYGLLLALYGEGAEAASCGGAFEQAEQWADIVLRRGRTVLERLTAYEVKLQNGIAQGRLAEAVAAGLDGLQSLGLDLPREVRLDEVWPEVDRVQAALGGRGMKELEELPRLTEPHLLAMLRVMTRLGAPAYQTSQALFVMIICRLVECSVTKGNSPYAAYGYASYGGILAGMHQHVEAGYRFGRLALAVGQRYQVLGLRTKILFVFGADILHWREPVKDTLPVLAESYQMAWESGDFEYGGYAAALRMQHALYAGMDLGELQTEMNAVQERLLQWGQFKTAHWNELFLEAVCRLRGEAGPERKQALEWQAQDYTGRHYEGLAQLIGDYLLRELSGRAVSAAAVCRDSLAGVNAMHATPVFHYYDSLLRLALLRDGSAMPEDVVAENQRKLWRWAQHAPDNHLHKYYLVEAERLRVEGRFEEAGALYDQAAALACQHDCIADEALAWELGGRFFLARNREVIGRAYLVQAHGLYAAWGAQGKALQLCGEYSFIQDKAQLQGGLDRWDWLAVFESSRIIAGERDMAQLLQKMVRIVLENSGAQRVCFIRGTGTGICLHAEGRAGNPAQVEMCNDLLREECHIVPLQLIRYALTGPRVLWLESAEEDRRFATDPYVQLQHLKSVLCLPINSQGKSLGLLYLEHRSVRGVFTEQRIRLLELLATQMAVALENVRLWQGMEAMVAARTNELEQALAAQAESERSYRLLAEYAADVIWTLEPESFCFSYASPSLFRLTGRRPEDVLGQPVEALIAEESMPQFIERLRRLTAAYNAGLPSALQPDRWDSRYLRRDATTVEVENAVTLLTDSHGQLEGILGISRDITERKALEAELVMLATTDMLTGIANRRHFVDEVQAELQRARRYRRSAALLVMDLDRFKNVNDTYGHPCGDEVLRQFTALCRKTLRNSDHLGRLGGEEFAALLPETALSEAKAVAERIRAAMEENVLDWEDQPVRCTVSIGVTVLSNEEESWETFLGRADRALYTAKRSGRNRVDGI